MKYSILLTTAATALLQLPAAQASKGEPEHARDITPRHAEHEHRFRIRTPPNTLSDSEWDDCKTASVCRTTINSNTTLTSSSPMTRQVMSRENDFTSLYSSSVLSGFDRRMRLKNELETLRRENEMLKKRRKELAQQNASLKLKLEEDTKNLHANQNTLATLRTIVKNMKYAANVYRPYYTQNVTSDTHEEVDLEGTFNERSMSKAQKLHCAVTNSPFYYKIYGNGKGCTVYGERCLKPVLVFLKKRYTEYLRPVYLEQVFEFILHQVSVALNFVHSKKCAHGNVNIGNIHAELSLHYIRKEDQAKFLLNLCNGVVVSKSKEEHLKNMTKDIRDFGIVFLDLIVSANMSLNHRLFKLTKPAIIKELVKGVESRSLDTFKTVCFAQLDQAYADMIVRMFDFLNLMINVERYINEKNAEGYLSYLFDKPMYNNNDNDHLKYAKLALRL
jgi:hypothetical protein